MCNPLRLFDTCVICYHTLDGWNTCVQTQNQTFGSDAEYYFICNCNICLHKTCLKCWLDISPKCPICFTELASKVHARVSHFFPLSISFLFTFFVTYLVIYSIYIIFK